MKFPCFALFVSLYLPFTKGHGLSCVSDFEEGKDYFPEKVQVLESEKWTVSYENSYKVVTNLAKEKTYLLYQCGTEPPEGADSTYDAVVSVPLEEFGIHYSTHVPFVEALGLRTHISTFLSDSFYLYSPCLKELVDEDKVLATGYIWDFGNSTVLENLGVSLDLPSFVGELGGLNTQFFVSENKEDSNLAKFEWVKYFSLFFNLEKEANEIYEKVVSEYQCAEKNAEMLASDTEERPTVLWASWSEYCKGWSVAREGPEYYHEIASACSSNLLSSNGGSLYVEKCRQNYMTTEEFVEFGKDAQHWIYTSPGINNVLSLFEEELKDFVSVKNKEVYDTEGLGANAWFELRFAEPDVLLQDFCAVVGHANNAISSSLRPGFFRNVYEADSGSAPVCKDPTAAGQTAGLECVAITTESEDSDESFGLRPLFLIAGLLVTGLALV